MKSKESWRWVLLQYGSGSIGVIRGPESDPKEAHNTLPLLQLCCLHGDSEHYFGVNFFALTPRWTHSSILPSKLFSSGAGEDKKNNIRREKKYALATFLPSKFPPKWPTRVVWKPLIGEDYINISAPSSVSPELIVQHNSPRFSYKSNKVLMLILRFLAFLDYFSVTICAAQTWWLWKVQSTPVIAGNMILSVTTTSERGWWLTAQRQNMKRNGRVRV